MPNKMPPTPENNRSDKGTGDGKMAPNEIGNRQDKSVAPEKTGQQGNIAQNTKHQGHQQDR